jgi:hypothetical protein
MLSKSFNKEFFESVYRLNECGGSRCGSSDSEPSCGRSGCGFKESLQRMNECGSGSSGCGGWQSYSCEIGSYVRIAIGSGCGETVETGRLLGYAD